MKYLFRGFFLLFSLAMFQTGHAQQLPPYRAEQDACGALEVCGTHFTTQFSYIGNGFVDDLTSSPCGSGESNSVWLRLNVSDSGSLVFTVTPNDFQDDYDWVVVDISNPPKNCSNFLPSDVIRCNFNNNDPVFNNGITGLDFTSSNDFAPDGISGNSFLQEIDAHAGDIYLIMVNNFGHGNGSLGSGFTIDFTGSTAKYNTDSLPALQAVSNLCFQGTHVVVNINKSINCSSIDPDGSDFTLYPPVAVVTGAAGTNCNNLNQGYTTQVDVSFSQNLTPGTYYLKGKKGNDNNSIIDLCSNALSVMPATGLSNDSIPFTVYPDNSTTQTISLEGCGNVVYNSVTYNQSTVVSDTVFSSRGCDSVYHIANITVYLPPTPYQETVANCDSVIFRGITYRQNATVTDTFKNHLGCDSFIHVYNIAPEHLILSMDVDPPEPVIGDYVTITITSNIPDFSILAWYPQSIFKSQFNTTQLFLIQRSDTMIVVGTSAAGCIDTIKTFVKADTLVPVLVMPNAFSPNGDGLNDVFEPKFVNKSGYLVKEFKIFDRWGKIVYETAMTKKAAWNGTYSKDSRMATPATYYYYIDVLFVDGTKKFFKGDVTLIR